MQNHGGIDGRQIRRFLEHHIGGPFTLISRPVVRHAESRKHLAVERVELAHDALKRFGPADAGLPVHESLRFGDIIDGSETVIVAAISHLVLIHQAGEPLASIDADLDGKRKPGLDASIHPTELGIDPINRLRVR
jgi:hypothetical protein